MITLHVAHFHIMLVFITENISKQAKVTKKLGRFETGIPFAPVLLFELYLAIIYSSTSHYYPLGILLLYELLSIGNSPALQVIIPQAGKSLLCELVSLFELYLAMNHSSMLAIVR